MKLIAGSSNLPFATSLANELKIPLVEIEISKFANQEKRVWIKEEIKGENVILVQSFSQPVDEHLIEFLLIADALERLGVRHLNAVIPWLGYSLQDKVFREGEPISAKVVANLISNAHVKRAFLMDLHNSSTPGFFSVPTHHLSAKNIFAEYVRDNFKLNNCLVASPDFGGLKPARVFANLLNLNLVNVDKHRDLKTGKVDALDVQGGSVKGKDVLIFDDVIVSGDTLLEAAKLIKKKGAKSVHFFASHGLFVANAKKKLTDGSLDSVIITNSIAQRELPNKIKVLDAAQIFAQELREWL